MHNLRCENEHSSVRSGGFKKWQIIILVFLDAVYHAKNADVVILHAPCVFVENAHGIVGMLVVEDVNICYLKKEKYGLGKIYGT